MSGTSTKTEVVVGGCGVSLPHKRWLGVSVGASSTPPEMSVGDTSPPPEVAEWVWWYLYPTSLGHVWYLYPTRGGCGLVVGCTYTPPEVLLGGCGWYPYRTGGGCVG